MTITTGSYSTSGFFFTFFPPLSEAIKKDYKVSLTRRDVAEKIIKKWHYSRSLNGVKSTYCFKITDSSTGIIVGAAVFGEIAMHNAWAKFTDDPSKILELRRLACLDSAPKNIESFFVSKCLKWLRDNTTGLEYVIAYADPTYGHEGTIYKALNFQYLGRGQPHNVLVWNGKEYHEKDLRNKHTDGKLKPFAIRLRAALERGDAYLTKRPGKHTYLYDLRRRKRNNKK